MLTLNDAIVANAIGFISVVFALFALLSKAKERTEKRHEQNLCALNEIRLEISKLAHLDPCVDELKEEILRLRERIHQLADALQIALLTKVKDA